MYQIAFHVSGVHVLDYLLKHHLPSWSRGRFFDCKRLYKAAKPSLWAISLFMQKSLPCQTLAPEETLIVHKVLTMPRKCRRLPQGSRALTMSW